MVIKQISREVQRRFVRDFVPSGRTHAVIYVVELAAHPGVTKIGRTSKWPSRRRAYASWNLAQGDGITRERVFTLIGEYVDLNMLERGILAACPYKLRSGAEWFAADFDDVAQFVEGFLARSGLDYE